MSLEQIDRVRYVDCSFPSVPSEAPRLSLDLWHSLSASEWQLRWAPSWSMQARAAPREHAAPEHTEHAGAFVSTPTRRAPAGASACLFLFGCVVHVA
jgi:hypothetical protein